MKKWANTKNMRPFMAKLGEFRRDMDRKFMWMIAGLVGVIAGQVALYFR